MEMKYKIVGYFTDWSIYARKYTVQKIKNLKITHLHYAFFKPNSDGTITLSDPWADLKNSTPDHLDGCLGDLVNLRIQQPTFKLMASLGGWTLSSAFYDIIEKQETIDRFAQECLNLVEKYGFDGIDLDWEYPGGSGLTQRGSDQDKIGYQKIVESIYGLFNPENLLISVAIPSDPVKIEKFGLENFHKKLSYYCLMAYDFNGSWSKSIGYLANLYPTTGNDFSVDEALKKYQCLEVPFDKMILGVPFYGRSFLTQDSTEKISNPVGLSFQGIGQGSWENGVYDYKVLPLFGTEEKVDEQAVAAFCMDVSKPPLRSKEVVVYDNPQTIKMKCDYLKQKGLGGMMFWSIDADSDQENRSLIEIMKENLKPSDVSICPYRGAKLKNQSPYLEVQKLNQDVSVLKDTTNNIVSPNQPSTLVNLPSVLPNDPSPPSPVAMTQKDFHSTVRKVFNLPDPPLPSQPEPEDDGVIVLKLQKWKLKNWLYKDYINFLRHFE
jgi:chitinase